MKEYKQRDYSFMPIEQIVQELAYAREAVKSLDKLKEMTLKDIYKMESRIQILIGPTDV